MSPFGLCFEAPFGVNGLDILVPVYVVRQEIDSNIFSLWMWVYFKGSSVPLKSENIWNGDQYYSVPCTIMDCIDFVGYGCVYTDVYKRK